MVERNVAQTHIDVTSGGDVVWTEDGYVLGGWLAEFLSILHVYTVLGDEQVRSPS